LATNVQSLAVLTFSLGLGSTWLLSLEFVTQLVAAFDLFELAFVNQPPDLCD